MRDESRIYDEYETLETRGLARLSGVAAAVASVLVLGVVVAWTYRLGVRDASDVPVIRAVEGPAKIRPEDPGGTRFAHQGRAVYGLMDGHPAGAGPAVLAPQPELPAAEDIAVARAAAAQHAQEAAPAVEPSAAEASGAEAAPEASGALGGLSAEIDQLVASVTGSLATGSLATDSADTAAAHDGALAPPPLPRPASLAPERADAQGPVVATPAAIPTVTEPNGPVIQLGAYLTVEAANANWRALVRRSGGALDGVPPIISPITGSTRTLQRLRAGPFASADEARSLCATLKARGLDCIVPRS